MSEPFNRDSTDTRRADTAAASSKILLVDDDAEIRAWLRSELEGLGFTVVLAKDGSAAVKLLEEGAWDVLVTDLAMPGPVDGLALSRIVAERYPDVPVVVMTAFGTIDSAVEAIRGGAYDYLTKPFEIEALTIAIDRAVEHHRLRTEIHRLERILRGDESSTIIGESEPMIQLRDFVERVADRDATVLITGASGTGKEVVARALHECSERKDGPFVAVNCAALPEALLESELFGHEKGAFTDARAARDGLFVQAHRGTLLLDEIGEMPMAMQAKLLRALEDRKVRPVGAGREVAFDARILASTNRDLEEAVEQNEFREDLYFRIHVLTAELPPLSARGGDVLLLARHFLRRIGERTGRPVHQIEKGAAEKLLAYGWPGNVRELSNCMERAVALARYDHITVDDLPARVRQQEGRPIEPTGEASSDFEPLEVVERRYIERVLEACDGNKTRAAEILGLDRKTLHRKTARWNASS